MADNDKNWVASQESQFLFRRGANRELASKLLEYAKTNRIVNTGMAQDGIVINQIADLLNSYTSSIRIDGDKVTVINTEWDWLKQLVPEAEMYNQTVGKQTNGRLQFIEGIKAWVAEVKSKGINNMGV